MDHVAQDASKIIGHQYAAGLIIDESGIVKKGRNSVGVARQWIGNIGKVENGQVGVYGSLSNPYLAWLASSYGASVRTSHLPFAG